VDLIVLDIMMPDGDGRDFLREIRAGIPGIPKAIPVIFLTARIGRENELEGLSAGGNDYLTKPYDIDVLIMKIGNLLALLKETGAPRPSEPIVIFGKIKLDIIGGKAYANGADLCLAPKEFSTLMLLAAKGGELVSLDTITKNIWDYTTKDNVPLFATISRLRTKLEKHGYTIQNKRAKGYNLEEIK
jgi:two-component system OmpR family response regulator